MADLAESVGRRFEVLRPHLNELQRRLWLGAEAAELGSGGVALVAQAVGVAPDTVRRGRAEAQELDVTSVVKSRRPGGGRKRAEEHDPGLIAALESLIDPVTRGDPMSPLRWTSKSTRTLARALTQGGHKVSDFVVRRLLGELGYSLQANVKTTEGNQQRRPVRLPQRPGPSPYGRSEPGGQCGHEEERACRVLQERRPGVVTSREAGQGQGPRLHRSRLGQGQPLRGLRRGRRHRLGLGGHRP